MDEKSFEDNYKFEHDYWWFLGRRKIVSVLVEKYFKGSKESLVLDAGCGTGMVLKDFERIAIPVGIDYSETALKYTKRRVKYNNLTRGDVCHLPFKSNTFNIVTILGVLYNKDVRDDDEAVKETLRVLKKDGILIVDEAAYKSLQSRHNYEVGGVRRYNRKQLIQKIGKYDCKILKASYWNMLMLPIFYLIVKLEKSSLAKEKCSKLTRIPNILNNFLKTYLYFEAFLLYYINIPFGPSILVVAKKL